MPRTAPQAGTPGPSSGNESDDGVAGAIDDAEFAKLKAQALGEQLR
ncbi:MAG: hypothetical protein JHC53_07530 [Thermoleophilia bacterium]|nr:hypothetical protein [Thermoleophilia bacterium]